MNGKATPEITPPLSHDDLSSDLAAHLRGGSNRVTWEDMQLGPSGSPRPDVYSMEPTYTRLTFEAFEIKVSVSDFRRDVTSGKWQSYLKYANAVTFAVPAGLIDKSEVPATCGLIVRNAAGVWRYAKKPTRHVLTDIPWQAWIKLLLDGVERTSANQRAHYWNEYLAGKKLAKKFGEETARLLHDIPGLEASYAHKKAVLDRDYLAEKAHHDMRVQQLRDSTEQTRERCSASVGRLALALGLPPDALLSDLHGRAGQLVDLLGTENRWRRSSMSSLAGDLEQMAKRIREADAMLGGEVNHG